MDVRPLFSWKQIFARSPTSLNQQNYLSKALV